MNHPQTALPAEEAATLNDSYLPETEPSCPQKTQRRGRLIAFALLAMLLMANSCATNPETSDTEDVTTTNRTQVSPATPREESRVLESLEQYTQEGDAELALEALREAESREIDPEILLLEAILLRDSGQLEEAQSRFRELVNKTPNWGEAWFQLALAAHAAGDAEGRDRALNRAISKDPGLAVAYAFRGKMAIARSDWQRAESDFNTALRLEPESVEALGGLAWVCAKTDRVDQALTLLDEAVTLDPENVYLRVDRSRVNVVLRHYNAAKDDLDFVIDREPDVAWHYLDRARIRLNYFRDYEGAKADLNMVEELNPGNFFALVYQAGLNDEQRHFDTAFRYYEQVLEAHPDYFWAYKPMGKLCWMKGQYARAADWFIKAAAEEPEEFSLPLMAGLALLRSGQPEEARRLMADQIRQFERSGVKYEVIRFCMMRGSDYYAVNALNHCEDETLRERLWFYLGTIYQMEGNQLGSQSVFGRIADRRGFMEYDMAYAAVHGMGQ